jgi:hypothetical protein
LVKKIRFFKVLSSVLALQGDDDETTAAIKLKPFWSEDPVHMTKAGYDAMVKAVLSTVEEGQFTRNTGSGSISGTGASSCNKSHFKRKDWVSNDDALAHRYYGPRGSWNTHRGHGGRGGNRSSGRGPYSHGGRGRGRGGPGGRNWPYKITRENSRKLYN